MRRLYYLIPIVAIGLIIAVFPRNRSSLNIIPPANTGLVYLIKIYSPQPSQKIRSPLKISGEARGQWYFEATSPVIIVDWDGRIIGEKYVTADPPAGGEWMTTEFVPFDGTVEFEKPKCVEGADYCKRGAVIFKKSNPSGLPQNDAAVQIPIIFE